MSGCQKNPGCNKVIVTQSPYKGARWDDTSLSESQVDREMSAFGERRARGSTEMKGYSVEKKGRYGKIFPTSSSDLVAMVRGKNGERVQRGGHPIYKLEAGSILLKTMS